MGEVGRKRRSLRNLCLIYNNTYLGFVLAFSHLNQTPHVYPKTRGFDRLESRKTSEQPSVSSYQNHQRL